MRKDSYSVAVCQAQVIIDVQPDTNYNDYGDIISWLAGWLVRGG